MASQGRFLDTARMSKHPPACTLASAALALLLSGCGSLYYAPKGAQTATLKLTNTSPHGTAGVAVYDNPRCEGGGKPVSYNAIGRGASIEVPVDAGKPLTFYFDGDRHTDIRLDAQGAVVKADVRRCQAPARFRPDVGGRYEAVFTDDGQRCRVEVFALAAGQRQPVPHESLQWGRCSG